MQNNLAVMRLNLTPARHTHTTPNVRSEPYTFF